VFAARPTSSDLLHRFELCSVLECSAVQRAALSPNRDLSAARLALFRLDEAIAGCDGAAWDALEVHFHRVVNNQSGNLVLAHMAERARREVHEFSARHLRSVPLESVQTQHRAMLRCIEDGQPELAVDDARGHLAFVREHVLASLERLSPVSVCL
jgi:DNA-binding GntR family transcriptional regulator